MKSKECEYESPGSPAALSSSPPVFLYPGRPPRPHSLRPRPKRQASSRLGQDRQQGKTVGWANHYTGGSRSTGDRRNSTERQLRPDRRMSRGGRAENAWGERVSVIQRDGTQGPRPTPARGSMGYGCFIFNGLVAPLVWVVRRTRGGRCVAIWEIISWLRSMLCLFNALLAIDSKSGPFHRHAWRSPLDCSQRQLRPRGGSRLICFNVVETEWRDWHQPAQLRDRVAENCEAVLPC